MTRITLLVRRLLDERPEAQAMRQLQYALLVALAAIPIVFGWTACSSASYSASADAGGGYGDLGSAFRCHGSNDCAPGEMCNTFGQCVPIPPDADGGAPTPPPEVENKVEAPASSKRYVYVAIADQNTVVKIDSVGLAVSTITVGKDPTALHTVPGEDTAVVLNRGAATTSVLRTRDDGSDAIVTLPTSPGLNALEMSPDGRHALAWFDLDASGGIAPPKQGLQDVTVIALAAGQEKAVDLSVGFRPSDVQFAPDGSAAYVITDDGVSIIGLVQTPKPSIVPTVAVRKDPLAEPVPTEVVVTPDGALALARLPKVAGFRAVDLKTRAITDFPLDGEPSDLDVSADGKLAVLVLREAAEVVFVDLPADLADPSGIEKLSTKGATVGQAELTSDSAHALLFTNASDEKTLLLADLAKRSIAAFPLEKGIRSVQPAPDGATALVIHNKTPGDPSAQDDLQTYLDKLQAYSLFLLSTGYDKLEPTDAAPGPTAFAPDSRSAYLLLDDPAKGVRSVEAIDLQSFDVTSVPLGSPPVAVGVVPSTRQVYVGQTHPLGRMTFVDSDTFETRTLTGFGLNGGIIQ